MSAVSLRPARPGDLGAIAKLFRRVRESTPPFRPDLHTPAEDRAFLGGLMERQSVWVAEAGGVLAGFIAYRSGFIDHLYVDLGRQAQGIGSALLQKSMDGEPTVQLWVFQKNLNARHFYERRGFRTVQKTDGRGNEEKEPDALMEWQRG